jgi:cell division protease FtsH
MSNNSFDNQYGSQKPNKSPAFTNLIVLILVIVLVGIVLSFNPTQNKDSKGEFTDLITAIKNSRVSKIVVSEDKSTFKTSLYQSIQNQDRNKVDTKDFKNISSNISSPIITLQTALPAEEEKKFLKFGTAPGEIIYEEEPKSAFATIIENPLFQLAFQIMLFGFIALFILRKLSDVNSKSISFGSSRAKLFDEGGTPIKLSFDDVAGNDEAKQELKEVVDFLKRPSEYQKMGAKIPRGVLLVGSPGNGKTLLARAAAAEAKVPFFFVSGSEFVEMFVGVGAGRVRDLFRQAKKKSPCIIFIDEIDAVGRKRGSGNGNGNDEREQTLNQILVEMDGFENSESVIVLAATNRMDVLDKALLRPGRFDRQITVTSPDRKERQKILALHSKGKKLEQNIDLGIIARRTAGFSGADLANLLNEAAILAVRTGRKTISNDELREAIEKVSLGPALRSKVVTEDQKKLTAYHEAGHAILSTLLPDADKVQKITIIPRGRAGGYTFKDQGEQDPMTIKQSKFLAEITVLYGGYAVEKMLYGEVSTGASNDIERATDMARAMVTKFGMSDLGAIAFTGERHTADGMSYESSTMLSEETSKAVDQRITSILTNCLKNAEQLVKTYRKDLDIIANSLIESETLEYEEYHKLVEHLVTK